MARQEEGDRASSAEEGRRRRTTMMETTTTKLVLRMPRPRGPGGRVKSLGSPVHPRVIRGVVVIEERWGGGGATFGPSCAPLDPMHAFRK